MNLTVDCPSCKNKITYNLNFVRDLPGGIRSDGTVKCRKCGLKFHPNESLDDAQVGPPMFPIKSKNE